MFITLKLIVKRKASVTIGEDDTTNTGSEEYSLGEAGEEVEVGDIPTVEEVNHENYTVKKGDTLGSIALKMGWYINANGLFGDNGYTQKLADKNAIVNRGLIYPGQVIRKY